MLAAPVRVVKESPAKLVTEHRLGDRRFFVKRYRHSAYPLRPFKYFFKRSQAHQEWSLAGQMSRRGIPIVRHLALGWRWSMTGLQESILITEGFDGLPANEVTNADGAALTAFVGHMAEAGFVQHDLHPANLLVRSTPPEIRLVDLHGTVALDNPPESVRRRNHDRMLALLCMTLPIKVPIEIEEASRALRKRALWRRSRRCLKMNRDFSMQRFGHWRWNVRTGSVTPALADLMSAPDKFIAQARSLKRGRSSTVATQFGVVLKRYNFKKPLNLLKDLFRGSRARRGFRKGYHLELCDIATPRIIGAGERRVFGLPIRSYVLMEEVPGACEAHDWDGDPRHAAHALGALLARLHDEGFSHRDLKESNILFNSNGVPQLIDLDGLTFEVDVTAGEAAANLRRLAAGLAPVGRLTRSNIISFLLAYCRNRRVRPRLLFPRRMSRR